MRKIFEQCQFHDSVQSSPKEKEKKIEKNKEKNKETKIPHNLLVQRFEKFLFHLKTCHFLNVFVKYYEDHLHPRQNQRSNECCCHWRHPHDEVLQYLDVVFGFWNRLLFPNDHYVCTLN